MKNLRSYISNLRLYLFGPRRVEDVMSDFQQAAADLAQAADHHLTVAAANAERAAQHRALEVIHNHSADQALRVRTRIQQFLS